ncbi:MAG: flagellar motor protein MotB [Gemmatimonadota bacterium]
MNKAREQPIIIIRKKARHGGGHHGGAWKVAFADFMTSMMALFLVLWLITQSSDVKSAIAGYFQDPLGRANEFGSSIIPGTGAQSASPRPMPQPQVIDLRRDRLRQLAQEIKDQLANTPDLSKIADHVEIELTDEGLRIQLLEDSNGVFFESGSAAPRPAGAELLKVIGAQLGTLPNTVVIEGHTDARPYLRADGYSNWELSVDRANAARRIMTGAGLSQAQVQQVRGWADRQLRVPDDPTAPSNRRVTVTMLLPPRDSTLAGAHDTTNLSDAQKDSAHLAGRPKVGPMPAPPAHLPDSIIKPAGVTAH